MCIISHLVRLCHCPRCVIIVSHVAIVITIVVVSRRDTAHRAVPIAVTAAVVVAIVVVVARNDVAIIVNFVARGAVAESEPKLGVNKTPWWLIEITQYVSPLLHCEIGIGNDIFQLLREVINEYIEQYAPGEESIRTSIPTLRQIIADTAQQQNEWDDSPEGLTLKTMKCAVATHNKRRRLVVASQDVLSLSLLLPVKPLPHIFPIKN